MSAVSKRRAVGAMAVAVLFLVGCSSPTPAPVNNVSDAPKTPAAPAAPVAAKAAFYPMYTAAHSWAPDVVILRVAAKDLTGFKNEGGKAALWEATFASPSLHAYRVDTYSIASAPPTVYKGVTAGQRSPWGGVTRDAMPVDPSAFTVDSDAAYTAAIADPGVAEWLKKNPDKAAPTTLELGNIFKFQSPVWYLVWGDKKSGYAVAVDATSGKVLKNK